MLQEDAVIESVQTSTKGNKPDVLVGSIEVPNTKVFGIQTDYKADTEKKDNQTSENTPSETIQSIVLRNSDLPIIGYIDGDLENLPIILPELATMQPPDPKAFAVLEQMILREGVLQPLVVGVLDGKLILLDGHMRLECIIKHKINSFKLVQIDIPSIEAAMWWIVELSNSCRRLNDFQLIEMEYKADPYYKKIAEEHKRLGGIFKNDLSKMDKAFKPIDRLKLIADKTKSGRSTVGYARYILKHGSPEDKEECRKGAKISAVHKKVKEKCRKSPEYQKEHNAGYDSIKFSSPEGKYIDQIHQGDCLDIIRDMQFHGVKDLAAMITSSTYNIGLDYGPDIDDSKDHDEFIEGLGNIFYESSKLCRDGAKLINVFPLTTNQNRSEGTDYKHCLLADLIYEIKKLNKKHEDCNLLFWGHFNWYKNHAGGRTCQGSMSSTSPTLRVDSEYIAVWVKNTKKLENIHGTDTKIKKGSIFSDQDRDKYIITPEEYNKYNLQTWQISPVHDQKYRHPARFPEEIPHRLIKLFTAPQDVILDPFCGSGTTCVVAKSLKRKYIGIDKVAGYCQISRDRLAEMDKKEGAA